MEHLLTKVRDGLSEKTVALDKLLVSSDNAVSNIKVAVGDGPLHATHESVLEWPSLMWVTCCGWRFGRLANVQVLPLAKAIKLDRPWCNRGQCKVVLTDALAQVGK